MPDSTTFDRFIQNQAEALRARDRAPASLAEWQTRRKTLREAMFAAMGTMPDRPCALSPKLVGTLKREGYRIEKLLFQSRPNVWVTASAYVPEGVTGKVPAVLVVHGHWPFARRDPTVQARCLGLVKLGFFVLAVDAFSAGERHPTVARSSYHGALLGSTLWPAGLTLLGVQVYENRRAVDYLLSRPEVDGTKLGITGASGGGNQSMYAGALDERFSAVVPVCSVGTYQAYLKAACCVCEVLPGALRFTEEGDVLGLVAPRALLVINATRDAFQFSVGEAKKSLQRAKAIFKLHDKEDRVVHSTFESPHDYNQAMRETMYGFMTRWLKNEGKGTPIPEPKHTVEKVEDLACFPVGKRPADFVFPPDLASREARSLLAWHGEGPLDHKEAWDARAVIIRSRLDETIVELRKDAKVEGKWGKSTDQDGVRSTSLLFSPEPGINLDVTVRYKTGRRAKMPAVLLMHLDGRSEALKHPLAGALLDKGWVVYAPDLRAIGEAKPTRDTVAGAPDHNSCEHALWIGRPLLGQWAADVRALLDFLAVQPGLDARRLALIGLGQAGVVALVAGGIVADRLHAIAAVNSWTTYVTSAAYPTGTRMGLLAPGILRAGDLPHLAALVAPRKLILAGGVNSAGKPLDAKGMTEAFAFPRKVYALLKAESSLVIRHELSATALVGQL
jgi:dienelactone hydrolase